MLAKVGGEGKIQELQVVVGIPAQEGCDVVELIKESREQKQIQVGREEVQFKTCCILGSCGTFLPGQSKGRIETPERAGWEIQH